MEKKSEKKKEEKKPLIEKKPPVEKLSIERKPRWDGPYFIDTNCQPWQYIVSFVFLAVLFGTLIIVTTLKYT
jgi:hypothetical protein